MTINDNHSRSRYISPGKLLVVFLVFIIFLCTGCEQPAVSDISDEPTNSTTDSVLSTNPEQTDTPSLPEDINFNLAQIVYHDVFNVPTDELNFDWSRVVTYGEYAHLIMRLKSVANLPDMRLCPGDQSDFSLLPPEHQYYDDIVQACSTGWFSTQYLTQLDEPMPNQTLQTYIAKFSEVMYDEYLAQFEHVRVEAYSDEDDFYAALSEADRACELNAIVKRMLHKSYQAGMIDSDSDGVFHLNLADFVTVRYFADICYKVAYRYTDFN